MIQLLASDWEMTILLRPWANIDVLADFLDQTERLLAVA